MYNRGGKVWEGSFPKGLVFLEKDWEEDRLPMDLVEEAGLLGGISYNYLPFNGQLYIAKWINESFLLNHLDCTPNPSREKIF